MRGIKPLCAAALLLWSALALGQECVNVADGEPVGATQEATAEDCVRRCQTMFHKHPLLKDTKKFECRYGDKTVWRAAAQARRSQMGSGGDYRPPSIDPDPSVFNCQVFGNGTIWGAQPAATAAECEASCHKAYENPELPEKPEAFECRYNGQAIMRLGSTASRPSYPPGALCNDGEEMFKPGMTSWPDNKHIKFEFADKRRLFKDSQRPYVTIKVPCAGATAGREITVEWETVNAFNRTNLQVCTIRLFQGHVFLASLYPEKRPYGASGKLPVPFSRYSVTGDNFHVAMQLCAGSAALETTMSAPFSIAKGGAP
ncbi:MAG TPA: hypothetical protein VN915_11140 [Elusimicrobiota bacterium]|nr:hypothetical protein [Elusimicrobiota bacterium]